MPFPSEHGVEGSTVQVSNGGGASARWSPKRQELFFQGLDRRIYVAGYKLEGNSFVAEKPRLWSETANAAYVFPGFDVAPEGDRTLVLLDPKEQPFLRVMMNLESELGRRTRR